MSAQTVSISSHQSTGFSALDVIGISLSTLLFTIVWVSLFAIFVPETSDVVFSTGVEKISLRSQSISENYEIKVLGASTVDMLKTGGNIPGVMDVLNLNFLFSPFMNGYMNVLGASTQSASAIGKGVWSYTSGYIDLLTFGLLQYTNDLTTSSYLTQTHAQSLPASI